MKNFKYLLVSAIFGLYASHALAEEPWTEICIYMFAPEIRGDLGIGSVETDIDVGFDDILKNLDMGAMIYVEHRRDKWSFIADAAYLGVSADGSSSSNNLLTVSVDVEFSQTLLEGFVGYRVFEKQYTDQQELGVDLLGGLRYNRIGFELDSSVSVLGLTNPASRERTLDWVDPVVGMRIQYQPALKWGTSLWLDYGGFGIESDSAYQIAATIHYMFDNNIKVVGGWRHYYFDYEEGSGTSRVALDLDYSGPILGVAFRF